MISAPPQCPTIRENILCRGKNREHAASPARGHALAALEVQPMVRQVLELLRVTMGPRIRLDASPGGAAAARPRRRRHAAARGHHEPVHKSKGRSHTGLGLAAGVAGALRKGPAREAARCDGDTPENPP